LVGEGRTETVRLFSMAKKPCALLAFESSGAGSLATPGMASSFFGEIIGPNAAVKWLAVESMRHVFANHSSRD
jgi:hypothetical protein